MDGRSNPANQFGSSRDNKQPIASKLDSAGKSQPGPRTPGAPTSQEGKAAHQIPKKEAHSSGRDVYPGSGHHAGLEFKSDIKTIKVDNVADIPLPTQAPASGMPPKPVLTNTTVITPALPPQIQRSSAPEKPLISSAKVEKESSHQKVEEKKPSSFPSSTPTTITVTTADKPKSVSSVANAPIAVSQSQKSAIISGIGSVIGASSRLFPLEGSSSKEVTSKDVTSKDVPSKDITSKEKQTVSSKESAVTEANVAGKLATAGSFITSAVTHTQPSEGLSSLVSYSSSSAEASASEDNAQDDQDDSSLSSVADEPMDTNESTTQFVGVLTKMMETEPHKGPEEVKKADTQEHSKIIKTGPCGDQAKTSESNQIKVIPVRSSSESSQVKALPARYLDAVKEKEPQPEQSKTIVKDSTEVQQDSKNFVDKQDPEDTKQATNVSVAIAAESKDAQQASDKVPMIVKESIPKACPPKPHQKADEATDSKQVNTTLQLDDKEKNSQIVKEIEDSSCKDKQEQPTSFLISANKEPEISDALKSAQEPRVTVDPPKSAPKQKEMSPIKELLSEKSFKPTSENDSPVDAMVSVDDKMITEKIGSPPEVTKIAIEKKHPDICVPTSVQGIFKETNKLPVVEMNIAEERQKDREQGKKRALENDDVTGAPRDEQEIQEPSEKRLRVEEMADSSSLLDEVKKGKEIPDQVAKPEKMVIELKQELDASLPVVEKMKEQVEKVDEESRDGLDDVGEEDMQDKENNSDSKDKDEVKEDEVTTPSKRKKKKKKSYERPRGEGGKFMKERPDPSVLDEETRMDCSLLQDEDSQGSASKREVRRFRCEVIVPESTEVFTADKVVEYVWPMEGMGEHYFIQEQISQYLGIMSFKRRYPDLRRRPIDMQERDFLKEKGLVSEMACDLGLTAVRSEDVLDVMFNDFPGKFEELQRLLRERKENEIRERGKVNYSLANIDKSKMQEYGRKAAEDAARWNASFNKEKREERRYSFDLQTFTLQMPIGRGKKLVPEATKIGAYPVAVLPGQFTDYFRQYSSLALKTMPLSTILAAPIIRDQLGSDGASSDSEEEASGSVTDATSDPKEEKPGEGVPRCKVCSGTKNRNKGGKPEPLIICGSCRSASHPTCIDLTLVMVPKIESYNWQCMDCKTCVTCNDPDDEDKMIFCDMCDRGYHIYCVGLRRVPNGRWHCKECAICSSCGSKTPAGNEHLKNAEWQHEFKKDKDNKQLRYATTLCVPCDKYWKRRQFCYVCLKVYRSIPEDGMVRCSNCPKYIHREGSCSTMYENERFCINCFKMRNSTALNHSRIIAAAKKKMASGY